ncbi:hypothetical protein A6A06_02635 [Streptomyces sp. CB02923]|uniref:hypothetical protein n=1 Tax=Streptomyces sp. CB02923 TaxID=1718985 RepID=UPI00093A9C1C|nr:hypothetical protein [Streptomyces sp. CB02923]OKI09587.1 hypothetical protein A6A06_02635 [Streptomyces sp. CB02923]
MHYHGYLWTGSKKRFDEEALRRPPQPDPPPAPAGDDDTAGKRLVERYREVRTEFPVVDLPPLETAYWLVKPGRLVRGTWDEPKEAAQWLGEQLAAYAPRFASETDRDTTRLAILVSSATERLERGGDVSHGFYLERPSFLSLALVCCSPNQAGPEPECPLR